MVSFELRADGSEVPVSGLREAILLSLPLSPAENPKASCIGQPTATSLLERLHMGGSVCNEAIECRYFDQELGLWTTDGCHTVELQAGELGCECSHLSEFIAVKIPSQFEDTIEFATLDVPTSTTLYCECVKGVQMTLKKGRQRLEL
eukprot:1941461-Prymnesium_polylepis.1